MSAGKDERRPLPRSGAHDPDHEVTADSTVRCWLCGRPLTAPSSVLLGIGPRCWDNRMGGAA